MKKLIGSIAAFAAFVYGFLEVVLPHIVNVIKAYLSGG